MLKKLLIIGLSVLSLSLISVSQASPALAQDSDLKSTEFMFDVGVITHGDIKEQGWIRKGINFVFERVITIMAATVGTAAVLMMSIGGFIILTSAGVEEQYNKGKGMITKAIIGLVFVFGAYILVTTVQILIRSLSGAIA